MNCKPGDLAVVIHADDEHIGRVCHVKESALVDDDGPNWLCEFPSPVVVCWADGTGRELTREAVVPDASLRPIRDPGEDARDETLDWLPVPTEEMA